MLPVLMIVIFSRKYHIKLEVRKAKTFWQKLRQKAYPVPVTYRKVRVRQDKPGQNFPVLPFGISLT
jgi:hypothetical protein